MSLGYNLVYIFSKSKSKYISKVVILYMYMSLKKHGTYVFGCSNVVLVPSKYVMFHTQKGSSFSFHFMPFTFRPLIFTPQARQRALRSLIYSLALSFSIRVTNSQVNICCAHSHLSWKKSRIIIHLKVTTRAQLEQLHRRSCRYYNNIHACTYLGHGGSEETQMVKNKKEQALNEGVYKLFETLVK